MKGRENPGRWLRSNNHRDCPLEFVRDFERWAARVVAQEGFNWREFCWFAERAQTLMGGEAPEGDGNGH